MAFDAHVNFAYATVATAPAPATSGTSLILSAGGGAGMPAVPFNATVWPAGVPALATNAEIVRVTARTTDTLTIVRAQESTTARAIAIGYQFAATITAKTLTDVEVATILPANLAKTDAGNIFTSTQTFTSGVTLSSLNPGWYLIETDAPANHQRWIVGVNAEVFVVVPADDLWVGLTNCLQLYRNGDLGFSGTLVNGTVPDARLSSNVALEDVLNVFTKPQTIQVPLGSGTTALRLIGYGAADDRRFDISTNDGSSLVLQALTDAGAADGTSVTISRAGQLSAPAGLVATPLFATDLTTGTVPDARLSANVALKNIDNQFVAQTLATNSVISGVNSALYFRDTTGTANATLFQMLQSNGTLYFRALLDSLAVQSDPLRLFRNGDVVVAGALYVGSVSGSPNPSLYLTDATQPANSRVWRIMNQSQLLRFYTQDDGESGFVQQMSLNRAGVLAVAQINVAGATAAVSTGGIQCTHIEAAPYHIRAGSSLHAGTDVYIGYGILEQGRVARAGWWTDFFPSFYCDVGTATNVANYACRYSVLGKTVSINLYLWVDLSAAPNYFGMALPGGFVADNYGRSLFFYSGAIAPATGVAETTPGSTGILFYRTGSTTPTAWVVGRHYLSAHLTFPTQ